MTYIRAKEIPPRSDNWYDYEVKTVHEVKRGYPVVDATLKPINEESK